MSNRPEQRLDLIAVAVVLLAAGAAGAIWGWLRFANGNSDETFSGVAALAVGVVAALAGLQLLRRQSR